jgi:hypothetical protein
MPLNRHSERAAKAYLGASVHGEGKYYSVDLSLSLVQIIDAISKVRTPPVGLAQALNPDWISNAE